MNSQIPTLESQHIGDGTSTIKRERKISHDRPIFFNQITEQAY